MRFLVVGGLNTLFGYVVYSLLALSDLSTWMVLIATNLVTISFNFVTTGGLVFRDMSLNKAPRFLICYGVIFVIYLELIQFLSPVCGGRIWAMTIIVLPMAVLTYFMQSWFVFGVKLNPIRNVIHRHFPRLLAAKFFIIKRDRVILFLIFVIFAVAVYDFQLVTAWFHLYFGGAYGMFDLYRLFSYANS